MKTILFLICFVFNLTCIPSLYAEDNTCWLMAPAQDDVWVIVYDADVDGNRGNIIWQGKISAGEKIKVSSTDGFIRYNYTKDPNQPYSNQIISLLGGRHGWPFLFFAEWRQDQQPARIDRIFPDDGNSHPGNTACRTDHNRLVAFDQYIKAVFFDRRLEAADNRNAGVAKESHAIVSV